MDKEVFLNLLDDGDVQRKILSLVRAAPPKDDRQRFSCFERGWELFQSYQRVSAHARQILKTGVFTRDNDFMSFICGGAQADSLKMLWDELKECVMSRRRDDAAILWSVFEYCVELVNASKPQAIYSILPTRAGDRFDADEHIGDSSGRAQGTITKVHLKGYKNIYNGEIIRKSIVHVD